MIVEILKALGLWLLAFVLTIFTVNIIITLRRELREQKILAGILMQVGFAVYSLLTAHFLAGGLEVVGRVSFPVLKLFEVSAISAALAAVLYIASRKILESESYVPPFAPRNFAELVTLGFIAAPLGEEILFRGLLEGYMLAVNVDFRVAVIMPATLFAVVHWIPFKDAPAKHRALILFFALIAGMVAGYYRAIN